MTQAKPTMVEEGICKYTLDCYGPRALLGPSKCSQLCWVTNSSTENLPKVDPDGHSTATEGTFIDPGDTALLTLDMDPEPTKGRP